MSQAQRACTVTKLSFVWAVITVKESPVIETGLLGCPAQGPHTAVAVSRPKIDEVSAQREGVAVFYLLAPHNAFMTADIGR
jgi:hypothetical protein